MDNFFFHCHLGLIFQQQSTHFFKKSRQACSKMAMKAASSAAIYF